MKSKPLALAIVLACFSAPRPAVDTVNVYGNSQQSPSTQGGGSGSGTVLDSDKIQLPDMGDSSGTLLSPDQEKELGESFFRNLHAETTINADPEIQQYIESIGHQLASHSLSPSSPFHFFVVMDPNINAFAGPGGYIGVNSGLILLTEAESELASVLGHEIAHVTQRHLYRSAESANRMSIPSIAATLAAILIGTQSPMMGQAALMGVQAGNVQFQINFTRDHEKEADRVGMSTLFDSNYDPRSMPIFFERMQQATRFYGNGVPEFLRTHPMSESRVADTRGRAETYPFRQYPDSIGYQLTKAKLRVMLEADKKVAGQYFMGQALQGTPEQRAVASYGMGLVYLESLQYDQASRLFAHLTAEYPNQPQYIAALARTASESHDYEKANKLYAAAVSKFPSDQPLKIEYVRSLLKSAQPAQALDVLQSLSDKLKKQPQYFELLSQTYSDLHRPGESHRYLAEYYYVTGQTQEAIMQIRLAREEKDLNYQMLAIINERLNFYMSEQDEKRKAKN
ncbi:MAG: M48 family metalloprotease [Methylococcales bacterium]|nr:M48 family metalloprotease [Methylococcales bacterium]